MIEALMNELDGTFKDVSWLERRVVHELVPLEASTVYKIQQAGTTGHFQSCQFNASYLSDEYKEDYDYYVRYKPRVMIKPLAGPLVPQ